MDKLIELLDNIRLASVIAVAGIAGALFALITGQISYPEFLAALAAIPAGAGVLGIARNGAGHGTTRKLKAVAVEGKVGKVRPRTRIGLEE